MHTEKEMKQIDKDNSTPDREGQIIVQNNRWFIVAIMLGMITFIQLFMLISARDEAEKPPVYYWMLMYPDGSWRIEHNPPSDKQEYFQATIDALLEDYVLYRYQTIPATIRSDYAKATLFMSPAVKRNFMAPAPEGFDAVTKAGEINENPRANTVKIEVVFFDHLNDAKGIIPGTKNPTQFIRSNVYVDEIEINHQGNPIGSPVRKIISLQWTLADVQSLRNHKQQYFLVNPLGLTILDSKQTIDTTVRNQ